MAITVALGGLPCVLLGTGLGLLAGYWKWLDAIVSRLTDVTLAFPSLIIAVGLAAISGPSPAYAAAAGGVAQQNIFPSPTAAVFPGIGIALIALAPNLFGDVLLDAFDPTTRAESKLCDIYSA